MSVSTTASTMAKVHGMKYPTYSTGHSTPSVRMPVAAEPVMMAMPTVQAVPTRSIPFPTTSYSSYAAYTGRSTPALPSMQSVPAVHQAAPMPMSVTPIVAPPTTFVSPYAAAPPSVTYAAPPAVSVTPTAAAPNVIPPQKLTEGLPDLNSIAIQKDAYLRALEEQERQALAQLDEQRAHQVEHLRMQGEEQKRAYALQVDQQIQHHDLALTQQHSEQMMMLNQQYSSQRGVLEHQANSLVTDFQQKKAHEDMLFQQYNLQREMHDSQLRFQDQLGRIRAAPSPASQLGNVSTNHFLPPTPAVLAPSPSQGRIVGINSYTPPIVNPYVGVRSFSHVPPVAHH